MGTVSFADLSQNFSVTQRLASYTGASNIGRFTTDWFWTSSSGNYVQLSGSGYAFSGNGVPTGGTANGFYLDLGADFTSVDLTITGLSLPLANLAPLVDGSFTGTTQQIEDQRNDLIWRLMLAGDDTINLGNASNSYSIIFAGDGRNLTGTTAVTGGNDTISGKAGSGLIVGDFYRVSAGATLTGGKDTITANGDEVVGDAYQAYGTVTGGDDTIRVLAGGRIARITGDVMDVMAGATVTGGNDTLLSTEAAGSSFVYGDSVAVYGKLVGGNDTITDGDISSFLRGDAYTLYASAEVRGGNDTIYGGGGNDEIYGDWVIVEDGARILSGGDDRLFGDAGDDTLYGNEGHDLLDGGTGADIMAGGAGWDTYYVDDVGDVVDESAAGSDGRDFVYSFVRVDLSDTTRFKGTIEWVGLRGSASLSITGTGNAETLVGNSGGNRIEGAGGNDTITGGDGQDLLYGGENDDTFIVEAQSQLVADENYIGGSGTDAIVFSNGGAYDYDLRTVTLSSIEKLQFGSSGGSVELQPATVRLDATQFGDGFSLTGTVQGLAASGRAETLAVSMGSQAALDLSKLVLVAFADPLDRVTITGDSDAETITGTAVADVIQGADGADTIAGGLGADTLDGGAGEDTVVLGGASSGYTFARQSATTWTVTGQDGTDTVSGFETVQFGDATVSFRAAANVAPVLAAAITGQTVAEDGAWSFQVPGGALTDADADALTFSATLSDGSALPAWLGFDAATRSFAGTPTKDFNGAIGLKVSASDGLASASGTFTLTVTPVNDAPVLTGAKAQLAAGTEDQPYTVTAADLLAGFTDVDGDRLAVTGLTAGSGASVTANADGSFTITPARDDNGPVALSYAVSDGTTTTAATQSFTLAPVNDTPAPSGTPGGQGLQAGREDTAYTVTAASLVAGFADADGDTLTVTGLTASRGTVMANADGTFTITPETNFNGTMQLSYTVADGASSTAVVQNLAIAAVNDAPVITSGKGAAKVAYAVAENKTAVATLKATDLDGDTLAWSLPGKDAKLFAINAKTGALAFKAAPDFEAPKDSGKNNTYDVTVKVSDGSVFDTQALTIKVTDVNTFKTGNAKPNTLTGTKGEDTLSGKAANDTLKGLGGQDAFVFDTALSTAKLKNLDTILDFAPKDDRIVLDNRIFAVGKDKTWLDADLFKDLAKKGAKLEADDRILYNSKTGDLSYDADGAKTKHAAIQFAEIANKAHLTAADFWIV